VTGPSPRELARVTDADDRRHTGMIRRFAVKVTSRVLWQLVGYKIDALVETLQAEPFTGAGFYSRPPRDGKPEAIVANVGGANSPVIVAVRDEKTRARVVPNIAEGETAVYSGTCVVLVRDGTVEIRLANGVAVPLATKADVDALVTTFNGHTHVYAPGPLTPVPTAVPVPLATPSVGTQILRGQ
jgi:hypothetical protein